MNVWNDMVLGPNGPSFNGSVIIKDRLLKLLLVPLIGCAIPVLSGLVSYAGLTVAGFLFSLFFFVVITQIVWQGSVFIVSFLRSRRWLHGNVFVKLFIFSAATVIYGVTVVYFTAAAWQLLALKQIVASTLFNALMATALVTWMLTLIYESAFLSAEVELNAKVIRQLDLERLQAEAGLLRNDLDPHFLFNCLNTLSYLVQNDADQAYRFVHKLSNVFKYLLISKQKEFVPLKDELSFLEDYYFLLRVRFEEAIRIEQDTCDAQPEDVTVPCTLQVLVENAIKRNFFSDKEPLVISISLSSQFITVSNPVAAKQKRPSPSKTAISNLIFRYRSLLNKEVLMQETGEEYLVKVPRIKKPAA